MLGFGRGLLVSALGVVLAISSASAQLLPSLGGPAPTGPIAGPLSQLPVAGPAVTNLLSEPGAVQAIQPTLDGTGLPAGLADLGAPSLLDLRRLRLREIIRQNPDTLDRDGNGQPVRRGVLLALDPDPNSLRLAMQAGFRVIADTSDAELGMRSVELAVPSRTNVRDALKLLRKVAPLIQADFDHLFEPAGASLAPMSGAVAVSAGTGRGRIVGMIDGGVASHPSLANAAIEQRGFAGAARPTGHGTAVASLLVGRLGAFQGAATGAQLLVADVYGANPAAGSASQIVNALDWLAAKRAQVINISLAGPPNKLVQGAIRAVQARGIELVAAVGNDGPAAPPQYPASYPGVVAVTAVDARGRALPEAGRPIHLDFAAPGADMAAALPGQGYSRVRGTSFATPLVAARLLIAGSPQRLIAEARPGSGRVGRGVVCGGCRIDPRAVGVR